MTDKRPRNTTILSASDAADRLATLRESRTARWEEILLTARAGFEAKENEKEAQLFARVPTEQRKRLDAMLRVIAEETAVPGPNPDVTSDVPPNLLEPLSPERLAVAQGGRRR